MLISILARCLIYIQIYVMRLGGVVAFWMMNRLYAPIGLFPVETRIEDIDTSPLIAPPPEPARKRKRTYKIRFQIYRLPLFSSYYPTSILPLLQPPTSPTLHKRVPPGPPVKRKTIIHFHGGAFLLGSATNDERYFRWLARDFGAQVISVDYPLAPEHPLPAAMEGAAGAIGWIWENADALGVDRERVWLSGKSAGADAAMAASVLLRDPTAVGYKWAEGQGPRKEEEVRVRGVVAFYPVLEWAKERHLKQGLVPRADRDMPRWMLNIFTAALRPSSPTATASGSSGGAEPSFVSDSIDETAAMLATSTDSGSSTTTATPRRSRRLAQSSSNEPLSADDSAKPAFPSSLGASHPLISLSDLPDSSMHLVPRTLFIVPAHDPAGPDVLRFARRMRAAGVRAWTRVVPGVGHGWDKPPFMRMRESVAVEYGRAVGWLWDRELMLNEDPETRDGLRSGTGRKVAERAEDERDLTEHFGLRDMASSEGGQIKT